MQGGSERLGVYYRQTNIYAYELRDHLGNVRAVVARNAANNMEVRTYTDYYPYGMPVPGYQSPDGYRYGYQGQYAEKDDETGWNAFELRMYDSRIGRWLQHDHKGEFWSPYVGIGNDPVNNVDPDGGYTEASPDNEYTYNAKTGETQKISDKGGDQYDIIHWNNGEPIMMDSYQSGTIIVINLYHFLNGASGYGTPQRLGIGEWTACKLYSGAVESDGLGLVDWIGTAALKKIAGKAIGLTARTGILLYEGGDGVRRAKAAHMLGKKTIQATNNAGEIFDVSIKNLRFHMKDYIDLRTTIDKKTLAKSISVDKR